MDTSIIIQQAIKWIPKFIIPKPKPPVTDFKPLYEAIPNPTIQIVAQKVEIKPQIGLSLERIKTPSVGEDLTSPSAEVEMTPVLPLKNAFHKVDEVSTACLSCSRSHLSTVSGALSEATRFAREGGISDPEVQKRLMIAEDEINILERIDLSPQSLVEAPPEERQVAEQYLPRIRKLRQEIGNITSVERLQQTAAEASILGQEFRLSHLQLKGSEEGSEVEVESSSPAGDCEECKALESLTDYLKKRQHGQS